MKQYKAQTSDEQVDECISLFEQGASKASLARKFEVTVETVGNWVNKKTRSSSGKKSPLFAKAEEVRAEYAKGFKTQKELAREYGVTQPTISCWINDRTRRAS